MTWTTIRFHGEAGQLVRAWVDAADSGSPLDAQLVLYRTEGSTLVELAESDDQSFFTIDPQLVYELTADDFYYLLVRSSIPNDGGARYFYHLSLAEETDPNELNDTFAQATDVEYGVPVDNATIGVAGDVDYYHFSGKAGDPVTIVVESESLGSSLDAKLTLMDDNYNDLAVSDDPDSSDARLFYTLPDDGGYFLMVVDADHGAVGGPEYTYQLRVNMTYFMMMPAVMRGTSE